IFWLKRLSILTVTIGLTSTERRCLLCLCLICMISANAFSQDSKQEIAIGLAKKARECFDKGEYEQALNAALDGDRVLQGMLQPNTSLRAMSQYFIAQIYLKKRNSKDAETYARGSLKTLEALPEKHPAIFIRALKFLAQSIRS